MAELVAVAARADRAGSLRSLTAFIAELDPDVLALYGISAGDALAFATRFARGWGYHRKKALFLKPAISLASVTHRFLPGSWWLRSILQVDGIAEGGQALSVLAVTISRHPERRDRQLERLSDHLAEVEAASIVLEPDRVYSSGAGVTQMYRRPIGDEAEALISKILV